MFRHIPPLTPDDIALLDRYHAGLCDDAHEGARARELLAQHPHERMFAELVRDELSDGLRLPSDAEVQSRFQQFERTVIMPSVGTHLESSGRVLRMTPVGSRIVRSSHRWKIIAGVTAAFLGIVGVWGIAGKAPAPDPWDRAHMITYTTGNGERARITLPDGSEVTLNVASRLDVAGNFGHGSRRLRLTGEAMFSVPRRSGGAFVVDAGDVSAKVLGTNFVVRRYASDSTTTVAVHDGKVSVRSSVVTAGRQLQIGTRNRVREEVATTAQFTFASGVLTLDGVPLANAVADLNRWYDADIRLADPSIGANRLRASLPAGSRGDLATLLHETLNVRVVQDGRTLTIYPQ